MEITLTLTETQDPALKAWTVLTHVETGNTIKIKAGDAPWTWTIKTSCSLLKKNGEAIINAYVSRGIDQHKFKGGYKEALTNFKVKIKP